MSTNGVCYLFEMFCYNYDQEIVSGSNVCHKCRSKVGETARKNKCQENGSNQTGSTSSTECAWSTSSLIASVFLTFVRVLLNFTSGHVTSTQTHHDFYTMVTIDQSILIHFNGIFNIYIYYCRSANILFGWYTIVNICIENAIKMNQNGLINGYHGVKIVVRLCRGHMTTCKIQQNAHLSLANSKLWTT